MNKKRYVGFASIMALVLSLLLISGCGSSNRDGDDSGVVSAVDNTACTTCHSTTLETLTGYSIVTTYDTSVHALNSVGCQACHGNGGSHNGVGPIPYPDPNYVQCAVCHNNGVAITGGDISALSTVILATNYQLCTAYSTSKHLGVQIEAAAPCNRCHTHVGAVLSAMSNFTGDGTVMAAGVNAPGTVTDLRPIQCDTCHMTHDSKKLRVDATWNPSTTVGSVTSSLASPLNDQFRLCTQCHGYTNPTGLLMGSGTVASGTALVGHHETSWYRIIGTTHYQDPAALVAGNITGYGIRLTLPNGSINPNPCYDCHGHNAMTNSNNDPASVSYDPAKATIYTDWAQSGHARGLLTTKYAAAAPFVVKSTAQVDAVMAATVAGGPFGGHNSGICGRCHTTEGFSYFFENLTTNPGTIAAGPLKCYGCHTNPGAGILRTLKDANPTTNYTTDLGWNPPGYTLNYGKLRYPDVAASNICIACHDSREKDPGAINDTSTNYQRTHYLQAAATMYVKMGFITFAPGALPGVTIDTSLLSDQDGGTITSTHRKLGTPTIIGDHGITASQTNLTANGPCVACHRTPGNHSLTIDQKTITTVCNNCHTSKGGHAITMIADFNQYFLGPQSEAYQAALSLAIKVFNDKNTGITITSEGGDLPDFVRAYKTSALPTLTEAAAADWTAAMTILGAGYNKARVMGAVSNIVFLKREPGAYAHALTYSRRLLYDTIDYLDDGLMNGSVGATALALSGTVGSPVYGLFGKGATAYTDSTLTTLAPGTTEAMLYLIGWSHTTGGWSSPERP
jgi:hypothetical protein